jgi:hypothetical protein
MVLSNTYQTASEGELEKLSPTGQSKDSGNSLFWRYNRRRIEAEAIRDAMLSVAGNLNPKAGGPAVLVPVQPVLVDQLYKPKQWAVTADPSEHQRRSIYLIAKRNLRLPFMEAFDAPDLQNSCGRREQSTHALQSLELLNGTFSNDQARVFAGRLLKEEGWNPNDLVRRAFRLATGREPTRHETQVGARFLSEQSALLRERVDRKEAIPLPAWMPETLDKASAGALCDFSLAMFSLPAFLYLD